MEQWKSFLEGYEVSNLGRVRSLDRSIVRKNGVRQTFKGRVLKPHTKARYDSIVVSHKGEVKTFFVHRLVAAMFVPNPNGYNEVNHLDENPKNNCADNLEWCTHEYNLNYGGHNRKISEAKKICVVGENEFGDITYYFPSLTSAAEYFGVSIQAIAASIKKGTKSCNLKWRISK
jgi:hypothetical protein